MLTQVKNLDEAQLGRWGGRWLVSVSLTLGPQQGGLKRPGWLEELVPAQSNPITLIPRISLGKPHFV